MTNKILTNIEAGNSRFLCLDFGLKRIGVAISDPTATIASGLPTIINKGWITTIDQIVNLVNQFGVTRIIVGKPLNMDGSPSKLCNDVDRFVTRLKTKVSLPIVLWDERMSSLAAERTLKQANQSPSRKKKEVDKIAAVFILQSYLDRLANQ
jgi:putative Holliday junction resolvase